MDVLRARRDVLRATISGSMTVLDALLRSQAATALDRQNVLDLILHDQVSLHQLDAEIQANLTDDEFEADILNAIDYDERICALRTRVRFSAGQDSPESPVPQPRATVFSACIATSTLCSLPEEARPTVSTKVTGDVPPARAMTVARVEKHDNKEDAARFNAAKEDAEGLSPRERLRRPPHPGVPVIAGMEESQKPCQDLAVTNATVVYETSDRPCCSAGVAETALTSDTSHRPFRNQNIAYLAAALETFQWPQTDAGVADVILSSETSTQPLRKTRIDNSTSSPETSDRPCHDNGITDATPALETSLRPCCDCFVGDAALVSETFRQPSYDSQTVLLDPATETRFVEKGITKRLLLRRHVGELRLQKRAAGALMLSRWRRIRAATRNGCFDGGDPFSGEHNSMLDAPFFYAYTPDQSKVSLSADDTAMLLQRIDRFVEAGQDMNTTTVTLHSRHVLWALGFPQQLFPFDPGGCQCWSKTVSTVCYPGRPHDQSQSSLLHLSHFDSATQ